MYFKPWLLCVPNLKSFSLTGIIFVMESGFMPWWLIAAFPVIYIYTYYSSHTGPFDKTSFIDLRLHFLSCAMGT